MDPEIMQQIIILLTNIDHRLLWIMFIEILILIFK